MHSLGKGIVALVAVFVFVSSASAEWGDLKLRFLLADPNIKSRGIPIVNKDCQQGEVPDESLIVNDRGELANVMVWLETDDPKAVAIHPDVAKKAKESKPLMEAKECRFVPHCLIASTGQTLVLENNDKYGYNWNVAFLANRKLSRPIPDKSWEEWPLPKRESQVADVSCSIHPWMNGWIMVAPTPYHGVSATDGLVTIKHLPAGEFKFRVWHEKIRFVQHVELDGKQVEWSKGFAPFAVRPDREEFHTVKLLPRSKK